MEEEEQVHPAKEARIAEEGTCRQKGKDDAGGERTSEREETQD